MSGKFSFLEEHGGSDSSMISDRGHHRPRVLIGCSGSVASVKIPELVVALAADFEVLVVLSSNSSFFLQKAEEYNPEIWKEFMSIGGYDFVLQDSDEWEMWNKIGSEVLHIELRKWADIFVVAPASANLIAKTSVGICDNLLTSIMRAWDFNKPCLLCPAMNTLMWNHPSTETSLKTLKSWGWKVTGPIEKLLACNEMGMGAMSTIDEIVVDIKDNLEGKVVADDSSNVVESVITEKVLISRSQKLSGTKKSGVQFKPSREGKISTNVQVLVGVGVSVAALAAGFFIAKKN